MVQDWMSLHTAFYLVVCTCAYICHIHFHIDSKPWRMIPAELHSVWMWKTWKAQNWTANRYSIGQGCRKSAFLRCSSNHQQQGVVVAGCRIFLIFSHQSPHPRRWPWMMDRFSLKLRNIQVHNKPSRPGVGRRFFVDAGFLMKFCVFCPSSSPLKMVKHIGKKREQIKIMKCVWLLWDPDHFVEWKDGFC